ACTRLAHRRDMAPFELHAAGTRSPESRSYLDKLQSKIATSPLSGRFYLHGELTREQKIAYYQSLDLLSTPAIYPERKGLPLLEGLACGVPVIAPAEGAFPELMAQTEGGILFEPGNTEDLAEKMALLLQDPEGASQMGQIGYNRVHAEYRVETMAIRTQALYQAIIKDG
ncbi:MAG: glycosyltransferase family 4 protein, partial [Planctomycetaceae bacterium]|nr:glycosyltransferase family 4 protein [Planctomycetaceae bacterium]